MEAEPVFLTIDVADGVLVIVDGQDRTPMRGKAVDFVENKVLPVLRASRFDSHPDAGETWLPVEVLVGGWRCSLALNRWKSRKGSQRWAIFLGGLEYVEDELHSNRLFMRDAAGVDFVICQNPWGELKGVADVESPGVIIPWNGGIITFDSAESRRDIDTVMELLDGHVVTWLIDRPCANVIELLGPAAVNLSDGSRMLFMILRTPAHVKMPRWILWIGRPGEADGFIRNARKRSVVDGYRLMQRPYEFTANPEDN